MKKTFTLSLLLSTLMLGHVFGQQSPGVEEAKQQAAELAQAAKDRAIELTEAAKERAAAATEAARAKAEEVSDQVRERAAEFAESEQAKETSATIIEWIGTIGTFYRPWINWALVTIGIALFVSHAGQLILGKLWTLVRGKGFSFFECVNDFLVAAFAGLSLPVVLMIPTGQAAFISNPLHVLSAAAVGMILGVILYTHGMKQELLAGQEQKDIELAEGEEA